MPSLTRGGNMLSGIAKQEPQMLPGSTQPSTGTEWRLLQALRSHHERLECKSQYQPLDKSQQKLDSVEWRNSTGFFDTGLRQILTKGDLDTLVEDKLEHQKEKARSHLEALCAMLDRLVNVSLLFHDSERPPDQDRTRLYPNLSSLLQLLEKTSWGFELATGQGNILFGLTSAADAIEAHKVVHRFNDFFSLTLQVPARAEQLEQPATAPWQRRNQLRDQAVTGLESLFLHVPRKQSEGCKGHQVLVKLPDWDSIGPQETEPRAALDLFLSTCLDSAKWHAAHCDVQPSIPLNDYDTCSFCEDLSDAHVSGNIFRFTASNGNLFVSCMDMERWPFRPDRQPTASLHELILKDSFVEVQSLNPLMHLKKTQRFGKKQKRALAARLTLCLSLFLDSEYTLNVCDSNNVFFIHENGQCERNMIYVTSVANDNLKDTNFDQSIAPYIALARLLLEIEYGVSLEQQELHLLKTWVDNMLLMDQEEEQDAELSDDMIDIRNIEARKIYLSAVRDLLNFRQTYRRGSWRLRGKLYDIGTIAREIIFTDIAEKIRSSIEPARLETSGLAGLKDELYQQKPAAAEARSNGHRPMDFGVNSASQPRARQRLTGTVIQLFDENDEISYDREKAAKADFFFKLLRAFHDSCEQRAKELYGTECGPHKRIRIAVLDTGIDKNNGAIIGGFTLGRIKDENCYSWVGNNPDDVHDSHGHGTNIAYLLLRVAPEAEIYICKVFSHAAFCADETKNIAKAIAHAVGVWNVDIITMSFGLKPPTPDDEDLKSAYRDIEKAIDDARHKILFAAAANHGCHAPWTFPASNRNVICIHASDGKGKDGGINPRPEPTDNNFMTLGIAIEFGPFRKSGTSYAAPTAAAMAAHILYITECLLTLEKPARSRLRTGEGMREMLNLMCDPSDPSGYRFVAPWFKLWTENWHCDKDVIQMIESTINTRHLFRY